VFLRVDTVCLDRTFGTFAISTCGRPALELEMATFRFGTQYYAIDEQAKRAGEMPPGWYERARRGEQNGHIRLSMTVPYADMRAGIAARTLEPAGNNLLVTLSAMRVTDIRKDR
jgi:hypothetical protein